MAVTLSLLPASSAAQKVRPSSPNNQNLVVNGRFNGGNAGWRTNNPEATNLNTTKHGRNASPAARLTATAPSTVVLNDDSNTVQSAKKGTRYKVNAWVRTNNPNESGALRVREVGSSKVKTHQTSFWLTDRQWHRVRLTFRTSVPAASLDLNILAWDQTRGDVLLIDSVRMVKRPKRQQNPPGSGDRVLTNGCAYSQRGIPDTLR